MIKTIQSENELADFAKELLAYSNGIKVFIFEGDLGTGKTTFIKQICKILGVTDQTSSPTYSIVNEYNSANSKIYHIDLYRLNSIDEAFEVGFEDYLYSENYCFIEWPQIAQELIPEKYISISIVKNEDEKRTFSITKFQ